MNKNAAKGNGFERSLLPLLHVYWPDAYRPRAGGAEDKGDFAAVPFCGQAKNHARWALPAWWRQVCEQAARAGRRWRCLIVKRKGVAAAEEQWVVLTLGDWCELMAHVERLERGV